MLSECHVQIQSSATGDALNFFFFLRKMASKHCVARLGFCKVLQCLYKDIEIHDDVLNSFNHVFTKFITVAGANVLHDNELTIRFTYV